ncbi:B12-binding domain-containing radical SAM protein [Candidatus Heimdallarchaeota archaeon B3_Heim]|nr:MAG: B12-binding domain-containing radical SAM protein [Candidatus Heimdallarchaeota archaeon B3_Heim]
MKILLVVPPTILEKTISKYKLAFLNFTAPPLGLGYIAAVLEKHGYSNINILDSQALALSPNDYRRYLKRYRPDFVGIQTLTPNFADALAAAKIAKEQNVPIVALGGYHPTAMPDESLLLGKGNVDLIFRGEAEYSILEFIQKYEKGQDWTNIKGISFLKEIPQHNPPAPLIQDLDTLPLPSRHLLPMDRYKIFGSAFPATSVITSRGCPFSCDFCSVSAFYGAKWRPRSPEKIAEEVRFLREVMDIKATAFVDDLFFISNKRVKILSSALSRIKDIYWGATTRADKGDLELLTLMRRAGCRLVFVGVESGNQMILDQIHKKTTLTQIERYFDNIKKSRMDSLASVSFGFPGETKKTIESTVDWVINRLDPSLALFTLATPYPGTEFYEKMLAEGRIKEHDYSKYNLFYPITELSGLTRDEMKTLTKMAYKRFYMRPRKIFQNTMRELRYSMESYGFGQFLYNSKVFAKGIINMKILTSM